MNIKNIISKIYLSIDQNIFEKLAYLFNSINNINLSLKGLSDLIMDNYNDLLDLINKNKENIENITSLTVKWIDDEIDFNYDINQKFINLNDYLNNKKATVENGTLFLNEFINLNPIDNSKIINVELFLEIERLDTIYFSDSNININFISNNEYSDLYLGEDLKIIKQNIDTSLVNFYKDPNITVGSKLKILVTFAIENIVEVKSDRVNKVSTVFYSNKIENN